MEIRLAKEEDIPRIIELQKQIYRVKEPAANAHDTLSNQILKDSCDVFVAEMDGQIVGTATLYYVDVAVRGKPYAFLEGLVINDAHRGKGHGTEFFNTLVQSAKEKSCYKIIFTSGTDRTEAHKFYEKLGFSNWGVEFRMDLD